MGRQVLALVLKELLALLRDARGRMVLVGPPLIQLIVFGYAATFDGVRNAAIPQRGLHEGD